MAVDKIELLKRYKELKAQGVEITLMELKKQIDGENVATNSLETSQVSNSSGVNDITNISETSKTTAISETVSPLQGTLAEPAKYEPNETACRMAEGPGEGSINSAMTGQTHQPQMSSSWTTSYYSQPEPMMLQPESVSEVQSAPQAFSSFVSSGLEPQPQPQILQSTPEPRYTGNISSLEPVQQNTEKQKYALIGYPLGHSLSSFIHNAGFASLGLDATYDILETPPDSLVDRIKFLKANNYAGFNVTIPLKLPVTLFLDEVDISADIVGAVNTVVINPDKTMKGYNTDVIGFRNAIPKEFVLAGKVAGVLGTGGAARAAITALAQSQVRKIKVYTRNIPNCADLMKFLREKFPMVEFEVFQIERIRDLSDINILVNTTPIGMQGKAADFTPIEENELRTLPQGAIVYDVIYNPKKTILLKLAQKNGYRTINGVDMFIHQAVAAEEIWTGKTPDFKDMKIAALENL